MKNIRFEWAVCLGQPILFGLHDNNRQENKKNAENAYRTEMFSVKSDAYGRSDDRFNRSNHRNFAAFCDTL